jgi:hypothetical protein
MSYWSDDVAVPRWMVWWMVAWSIWTLFCLAVRWIA